jgi:hypothetical protein
MAGIYKIDIVESELELKKLLATEKSGANKERIQVLYLIAVINHRSIGEDDLRSDWFHRWKSIDIGGTICSRHLKNWYYWEVTTDPETMPKNSTSLIMTNIRKNSRHLKQELGNLYGLRTWVEYSFRQGKQELGWNDYRLTKFEEIRKWWEIIMSSYLMISLSSETWLALNSSQLKKISSNRAKVDWTSHPQWNHQTGWKNILNNFRLMIQPSLLFWSISPWHFGDPK